MCSRAVTWWDDCTSCGSQLNGFENCSYWHWARYRQQMQSSIGHCWINWFDFTSSHCVIWEWIPRYAFQWIEALSWRELINISLLSSCCKHSDTSSCKNSYWNKDAAYLGLLEINDQCMKIVAYGIGEPIPSCTCYTKTTCQCEGYDCTNPQCSKGHTVPDFAMAYQAEVPRPVVSPPTPPLAEVDYRNWHW